MDDRPTCWSDVGRAAQLGGLSVPVVAVPETELPDDINICFVMLLNDGRV
jgi:hypothetical protein